MSAFRAAVVQMRSTTDVERNIKAMEEGVRAAAGEGAFYVQTPEMTGLVQQKRKPFFAALREQEDDPLLARAAELADELNIYLHVGSTPVRAANEKAANRACIFAQDGQLLATYDKLHMFDVDLDNGESWRESAVYEPGAFAVLTGWDDVSIGLGICYDIRFPDLADEYAQGEANVLTFPSCFTRQTGEAHWHVLQRARAIETGSFVISAAQGGQHEDGRETFGHSLIVNPWGEIIAQVEGDEPGIALATIDVEESAAARRRIPNLRDRSPHRVIAP